MQTRRSLSITSLLALALALVGCTQVPSGTFTDPASVFPDESASDASGAASPSSPKPTTAEPSVPGTSEPDPGTQVPSSPRASSPTAPTAKSEAELRTAAATQVNSSDLLIDQNVIRFLSPSGNIYCMIGQSPSVTTPGQPATRLERWGGSGYVASCDLSVYPDTKQTDLRPSEGGCRELTQAGGSIVIARSEVAYGMCRGEPTDMQLVELGLAKLPAVSVLPYDTSVKYGDYQCRSAYSGMTCANLVTGKGFEVSRDEYEFFG